MLKNTKGTKVFFQFSFLTATVAVLLFAFQNCGMHFEEEVDEFASDGSGVTFNADGTMNFPLPGQNTSGSGTGGSGSSGSGSGGNINLGGGSGGSGGTGGSGSGGGGGYGGGGGNYFDNYRTSSLYPDKPNGDTVISKNRMSFERNGELEKGDLLWASYSNAISSWNQQEPGTSERQKLIVVSMKKLSSNAATTTYGLTGTSLCYKFSASVTAPTTALVYQWQVEERYYDNNNIITYRVTGFKLATAGVSIVRKTEEELTQLESAGCSALASYDKGALDSFISILHSYPIVTGDGSQWVMRYWNGGGTIRSGYLYNYNDKDKILKAFN